MSCSTHECLYKEFFGVLSKIGAHCHKENVQCTIHCAENPRLLPANVECGGVFSDPRPQFYPQAALQLGLWNRDIKIAFQILVHEYNHMLQWLDHKQGKCPSWSHYASFITPQIQQQMKDIWKQSYPLYEPWDLIGLWLAKEIELEFGFVKELVLAAHAVELDCEHRTVALIYDWKIESIDVSDYIQKANAYMYFYPYFLKHRFWNKGPNGVTISAYQSPDILQTMPKTLLEHPEGYYTMPPDIEAAFDSVYLDTKLQ